MVVSSIVMIAGDVSRRLRVGGGVPLEKFPGGSSYRRLSGALHLCRRIGTSLTERLGES